MSSKHGGFQAPAFCFSCFGGLDELVLRARHAGQGAWVLRTEAHSLMTRFQPICPTQQNSQKLWKSLCKDHLPFPENEME